MPQDLPDQQRILDLLQNFRGIKPLRELFCTELNYDYQNAPISLGDRNQSNTSRTAEDPLLFATGGENSDFHLIYTCLNSDRLRLTAERPIISRLLNAHPYALFIFSNREQTDWHFVNAKYDPNHPDKRRLYRRITIGRSEKLRTASERIAKLDAEFLDSPLEIQHRHDEAFDVEAVTKEFFKSYQTVFQRLQDDLTNQTNDNQWAHDYALQFLNRCMFLYFIQRKGWLGDDTEFLKTFWESYQTTDQPVDSFVERWLNVMFFEAFNDKFHGGHRQFPDEIRRALAAAPFLNGGLFTENDLDNRHEFQISDSRFKAIFNFLENFNFTIAEDSPLDQEVAVDPEMIGKVYESLVNVSEETDERGDAGIFYTPRTEIDLMCRLALVDNLTNHLGEEHKSALYEAVFAFEPEEKADADQKLKAVNLWNPLDGCLKGLAVVDPTCGSGSFLVGMLYILDDLRDRANRQLGHDERSFDRKKAIIGGNLYGVDVMEWACRVAELRLWLSLIIDADIPRAELQVRNEPLLPHFSFNIRCGDSLLQEIGGMNLVQIRADFSGIPRSLKSRTTRLKNEKLKFFNNDKTCRYRSKQELEQEELNLFRDLVDTHAEDVKKQIDDLKELINDLKAQQMTIEGTIDETTSQKLKRQEIEWSKQIEVLTIDYDRLVEARGALANAPTSPFVWDIAFVEIFSDDKGGFDIVIGNPPYVRQENIADPKLPRAEAVESNNKKSYKAKLARSVYQAFPRFFGYKREKDIRPEDPSIAVSRKIGAKSDLYIYFYFHGISLLNSNGSFCFITSNSWLDVGYGKDLQEFLVKHCRIKQIIDNQSRRSFASADVNTVICLFSAPDEKRRSRLDEIARFVMFKTPFEGVLDAVIFEEVEGANERTTTEEHRIFPVPQHKLLETGIDYQTADRSTPAKYTGDKWGGKYLRAPDIYWTILEKGKDKLVRLGDVAEVRRGFTTGANDFFYLDAETIQRWGIEDEFLKPVIKSPRECKSILIDPNQLKFKLFMCGKNKEDLDGTAALEYIEWGESQGFDQRPSCRNRARWWDLGQRQVPRLAFNYLISSTARTLYTPDGCFTGDNFQEIHANSGLTQSLCVSLNSSLFQLMVNMAGRSNFGGGLLKIQTYEVSELLCLDPATVVFDDETIFASSSWEMLEPSDDRRALDAIVFDVLNLTQGERDGVYEAVVNLVEARLSKARSLRAV